MRTYRTGAALASQQIPATHELPPWHRPAVWTLQTSEGTTMPPQPQKDAALYESTNSIGTLGPS